MWNSRKEKTVVTEGKSVVAMDRGLATKGHKGIIYIMIRWWLKDCRLSKFIIYLTDILYMCKMRHVQGNVLQKIQTESTFQ